MKKSLGELVRAAEAALAADWRKSWTLFVAWSLFVSILANTVFAPINPTIQRVLASTTNLTGVTQIAGSDSFGLALKSDGSVVAWGNNGTGQLGDGTTDSALLPQQVPGFGAGSSKAVSGGWSGYSLVLKNDGTVWAWGENGIGQLGDGTTTARWTPAQIASATGVAAISAGFTHALALKSDGTVLCWGRNALGACGQNNTTSPQSTPVFVKTPDGTDRITGITGISAGTNDSFLLKADGTVYAIGNPANGELGNGATTGNVTLPTQIFSSGSNVTAVSAGAQSGANYTLALKSDGTVMAWGSNTVGQLGDGTTTQHTTPVQVPSFGSGSGITAIAAGGTAGNQHSFAVKSDGTVYAWGNNGSGQLGDGTTNSSLSPITILSSGSGVTAVSSAEAHTYALKSDGTALAWGDNSSGQLGNGNIFAQSTPTQATGSATDVTAIAVGYNHVLALRSDGTVWAWGNNSNGQLGNGSTTASAVPVQVTSATGVTAIAAGNAFSLALKSDGTVLAWGNNSSGQLGNGTTVSSSTIVQVSSATGVAEISASDVTSFGRKSDGTLLAWGGNVSGQIGDGTTTQRTTPVFVKTTDGTNRLTGVSKIASSEGTTDFAFALLSDGTVLGWGINALAQLGVGDAGTHTLPTQVFASGSGVTALATYGAGGLALKSDGTVYGWGANTYGTVGDGTVAQRTTPVQTTGLGSGSGVTAIAGGASHSIALKSDGTMLVWGSNNAYALGDGTLKAHLTPATLSSFGGSATTTAISGGNFISGARMSDGTVYMWGANSSGQIGNGVTYTYNLTPANILATATASTVGGGSSGLGNASLIQVTEPHGGEQLTAGAPYLIFWNYAGNQVRNVRLSLSTDGGATFPIPIATLAPGSGYYPWTVAATNTEAAVIKAEALGDGDGVLASSMSQVFSMSGAPETGTPSEPAAPLATSFDPAKATDSAASIDADKNLTQVEAPLCSPGTLIRGTLPAVYYCAADGKRYVFPTLGVYRSWYNDFSQVLTVPNGTIAKIPLGGAVTYKPGVRMVKIATDPRVYAVAKGGILRWVTTETLAQSLYGQYWSWMIDDLPDSLFASYTIGDPITTP